MIQRRTFLIEYEYMEGDKVNKVTLKVAADDEEEAKTILQRSVLKGASITITNVTELP